MLKDDKHLMLSNKKIESQLAGQLGKNWKLCIRTKRQVEEIFDGMRQIA